MKENGLRVELDTRTESVGRKVRDAQQQEIPAIINIGEKEVNAKTIAVRTLDGKVKFGLKTDSLIKKMLDNSDKKELKFANIAFTTERLEGGILKLEADGIEVIQFQFWDRMIKKYYSDGVKLFRPHRALLTIKENTQIGTEEEGNLSEMGSIYDPIKLENHLDTGYNIDAKIIEDYKVQLGY